MKAFYCPDGLIIFAIIKAGMHVFIVTGRNSDLLKRRMTELGVTEIHQDIYDKSAFLNKYMQETQIYPENDCYIWDDLNDFSAMMLSVLWHTLQMRLRR